MRFFRPRSSIALAAALVACAAPEPPRAQPLPPAPVGSPTPSASAAPLPAPDAGVRAKSGPPPRLERIAPAAVPSPEPHVEILFPFAEQRILIPKAAGYTPRFTVEHWPLAADGPTVMVALDDARPRRLTNKPVSLRELAGEGQEIKPGPHHLFAFAADASGSIVRGAGESRAPMAAVRFWVGDRDPKRTPGPRVMLAAPQGTINGAAAADALRVDFLALPERLGPPGGAARVRVRGAGVDLSLDLDAWQPTGLRDLPSGDFDVEVVLLDKDKHPLTEPGTSVRRTITVNRELEPSEAGH
ncbi:MAG: hypothetical protein U0263_40640 [Polyangiaceae bacterium]